MNGAISGQKDAIFALADNLLNGRFEDLPPEIVELTKLDILDTLGVSLASTGTAALAGKVVDVAREMGGKEESTVIAYGDRLPSSLAAFVNAALAHSLNYGDLNDALGIHVACTVFPAAFAAAERVGKVDGREFITSYAYAMDMECRMARALVEHEGARDWDMYGWLLPQVFGAFGAAGVAGRLFQLNKDQLVSALGLAYCQASGNMQLLIGTGSDKGIYPAFAAQTGVLSALMASKGIAGPRDMLEGKAGLYAVYFQGEYSRDALVSRLGKRFEGVGFFPFPCCGASHSFVEVALKVVSEYKVRSGDVEAITVLVGPRTQRLCEPLDTRRNPRTMTEAQFSIPFTVATALARGKPRVEHFVEDSLKDTEVLRLSNVVGYRLDPKYDVRLPFRPAGIEIRLRDGRLVSSEQEGPRYGDQQRPMSKADLAEKFKECAKYSANCLSPENVAEVVGAIDRLETAQDVSEIIALVSGGHARI